MEVHLHINIFLIKKYLKETFLLKYSTRIYITLKQCVISEVHFIYVNILYKWGENAKHRITI